MFRPHVSRTKPQPQTTFRENAKFTHVTEVVGVRVVSDAERYSRVTKEIRRLAGYNKPPLPVNWPEALTRDLLHSLKTSCHVFRLKPKGPRWLMYADNEGTIYMENHSRNLFEFDEDHALKIIDYRGQPMRNILIDGTVTKLVSPSDFETDNCDSQKENGDRPKENCRVTFLIHDALHCNGRDLKSLGVMQRIQFVEDEIMKPRRHMIKSGLIDIESEPFDIEITEYVPLSHAEKYLRDDFVREEQKYIYQSIIFYPLHEEYAPAIPTGNMLYWDFKTNWKFDFLFKQGDLYIGDGGRMFKFGTIAMTDELRKLPDGCIITCSYEDDQWIFKWQCFDRKFPNGRTAVERIFVSSYYQFYFKACFRILGKFHAIHQDPISKEELLAFLETSKGQVHET